MRTLALGVGMAMAMLVSRQVLAELPILDPSRVSEQRLPNGLTIVTKEERQWPVVSIGVYVRAGSLYEARGEQGMAHLVEHMLFETRDDSGARLAPQMEAMGGRIAATTMRDFVQLNIVVASRYLEQVLPLAVRATFEAQFDDKALRREIAVVKREMEDRADRADLYLSDMLWGLAFKEHPYGRPIGGRPEDVDKLSSETVSAFHRRFYVPNNTAFVVVGDVEAAWLKGRLAELAAKYRSRPTGWQEPPPEAAPTSPRVLTAKVPRDVSLLGLAWHAPSVADKSSVCAMDLVYTLLGEGATGRLHQRLVEEKKVALAVSTEFLTQKAPGLLIINALVPRGREQEAQVLALDEVGRLAEELVSAAELDQAKRLLYTDYAFTNESCDDQVGSMGFYQSIGSHRFALDYIAEVMRVTPAQIQTLAREYLRRDAYSLVVLEAAGSVPQREEQGVDL